MAILQLCYDSNGYVTKMFVAVLQLSTPCFYSHVTSAL